MRSLLIASGDDEAGLAAAFASNADAVVVDVDVVNREVARSNASKWLKEAALRPGGPAPMARIGPLPGGEADGDLEAVMAAAPRAILLPQARGGECVQQLSVKLALREALGGLDDGMTGIIAVVDTAEALLAARGFCGASSRLIGLAWDAESLRTSFDTHAVRDGAGDYAGILRLAREITLVAAVAAGVAPIDSASDLDEASLRLEAETAQRYGFRLKLARRPSEARIINEVFSSLPPAAGPEAQPGRP